MLQRLLIANRGEIAVRIIHACREAGVSPIAVYSDADADSPHVLLADAAYRIGPGPPSESYLSIQSVLEAARIAGVDAIHPGYGFLSENADFADACAGTGVGFVGPQADGIRRLGDKIAALRLAESLGIPIVPGYRGDDQSEDRLRAEAERIGPPLLVKAAAGGGGRGMRVVKSLSSLPAALDEAGREAGAAFGDPRVFLEKRLANPRHVEVQIVGDRAGRVCHLFERECSIQRRHQKIIEESPSTALTAELRAEMTEAAVRLAAAAGYTNAGTVEFLVEELADGARRFYFLEVNARLQVEHPVTEMVTGIDLVKLQIQVAAGGPLPFGQEDVRAHGHAIEARIYAEDPEAGFAPSVGRLTHWRAPAGPWVRVDSGVAAGSTVSPFYDPMLAKLIVWGRDRPEALLRLEQALGEFEILGVRTNLEYLLDIVRHPEFRAGRTHTGFLPQHFPRWRPPAEIPDEALLALAAEAVSRPASSAAADTGSGDPYSPWRVQGSRFSVQGSGPTTAGRVLPR